MVENVESKIIVDKKNISTLFLMFKKYLGRC